MQFIDGGRRFQCPFCKATSEVPSEYFQHLDHTGMRMDKYQRPELCLGSYEFVGTKDYCRNNVFPKPPAYIFVLDVSYNNVKSGLVHLLCQNIKSILQNLPRESVGGQKGGARVGFITYSKEVHFYNIKSSLAQPQMMVVGDVDVNLIVFCVFERFCNSTVNLVGFRTCLCRCWTDSFAIPSSRRTSSTS
jgi:protein transport protein SEC24